LPQWFTVAWRDKSGFSAPLLSSAVFEGGSPSAGIIGGPEAPELFS
jgi:hypothetical protein